jgi:hypothetical protein
VREGVAVGGFLTDTTSVTVIICFTSIVGEQERMLGFLCGRWRTALHKQVKISYRPEPEPCSPNYSSAPMKFILTECNCTCGEETHCGGMLFFGADAVCAGGRQLGDPYLVEIPRGCISYISLQLYIVYLQTHYAV